ncbi:MAG: serine hydrolase [Lentilactobacillus diolivorans]|uniref:D-alanyl-D-alanine carboxypeptidase family protein n=1 Tax=Lentilactobacillus diolivorans TaxID=179838 RepID=UPI0039EAFC50
MQTHVNPSHKQITSRLLIMIATLFMALAPLNNAYAKTNKKQYQFEAKEIYVMDVKSGQMIYQKNGNQKRPIASLSKLMTLYLTKQAIDRHKLNWNQKVAVSKPLIKMSKSYELGTFKIKHSKQYTVKQLYQAALIASSNSAAIALGQAVANGNNTQFIKQMNQQAKKWHIDANFVSSSGLDNTDLKKYHLQIPGSSNKAQNMVSAKAISTVAAKVLTEFPSITNWSKKSAMKVGDQVLVNSNRLLPGGAFYKKANHVDGLKTGFTDTAGLCLTISYWKNGRHLIATIIDSNTIFSSMVKLIKSIDRHYRMVKVPLTTHQFSVDKHVVTATPQVKTTAIWLRRGSTQTKSTKQYTKTTEKLPVKQGEIVGNTLIKLSGGRTAAVPMLAANSIKANVNKKTVKQVKNQSWWQKIGNFILNIFVGLVALMARLIETVVKLF